MHCFSELACTIKQRRQRPIQASIPKWTSAKESKESGASMATNGARINQRLKNAAGVDRTI